jgi:hypothetical protein
MGSDSLNEQTALNRKEETAFVRIPSSPQAIAERIDAIIHELEMLRSMVVTVHTGQLQSGAAKKLFGVLGKGSWDEYDSDIEWRKFDT